MQSRSYLRYQVFGLSCLLLISLTTGCSKPASKASVSPSPSPVTKLNDCELAAQDKSLSTDAALQRCLVLFHHIANQSPLIFMPKMLDGGKVEKLGNNQFVVTITHQDEIIPKQHFDPGIDNSANVEVSLNTQIFNSISRLAYDAELLLTLFGKRGLTRIEASLYTDGVRDSRGDREMPEVKEGNPIMLMAESYRVKVRPADLPKIKAWRKKESQFKGNPASDPALNKIWKVELNRYPDYKFEKNSSPDLY